MRGDMTDDYYDGINDAMGERPYNVDAPGVHPASYGTGYDEGCFMRREREEAATSPVRPETMGDRIRSRRTAGRLSLGKLSAAAGTSKSYLWELEAGRMTRPSADKLSSVAAALGVTIDHLANGDDGLPAVERMRAACLETVWEEARGWQSARGFSWSAEIMAANMEKAIRAIDARDQVV